jgi:hypothetical protein
MHARIILSGAAVLALVVGILGTGGALADKGGKGHQQAADSSIVLDYPAVTESATAAVSWPRLGDSVTFTTVADGLAGWEYPMVVTSCYQDVNGDGTVDTSLLGPDVVYTWLDTPDAGFLLGAYSSIWTLRGGGPAECRADLDAYGWKGGKESTRVLASVSFHVDG